MSEALSLRDLMIREHRITAEHKDGTWHWSCSCGMQGQSADRRDHWADIVIQGIAESHRVAKSHGKVEPTWRLADHEEMLRDLIYRAIDDEERKSKK